jgi:uncharacterized protein (TIGR01777 family)
MDARAQAKQAPYVVSGASGMLGTALRNALAAEKLPTVQLVRGAPTTEGQLEWNPAAGSPLAHPAALEGCQAAIHLSGSSVAEHRWTAAYKREIAASRVESTRALATVLAGLQRPPQTLLVASAIGIYGDRGDEELTEESAPGRGFLAGICREWEAAARPAVEAGIRVVHLRFGAVLAPGYGALAQMLPPFRRGLGGRLGNGRQWMSWVSLADAIAAILYALDTPSLAGPVNVTSPNPVTNADFTRALGRQLGKPAFLAVPAFAVRLVFGAMANEALLSSTRAVPARLQKGGFYFTLPTVDKAIAAALLE